MQDTIDSEEIGSKSREAIAEGLLDLSILNKAPGTYRGTMAGGRYYISKHEDMSRGFMNTAAWHGKNMGLKGRLRAWVITKQNNSNNTLGEGSGTTSDGDVSSNTDDATTQDETPRQATHTVEGGVQIEYTLGSPYPPCGRMG